MVDIKIKTPDISENFKPIILKLMRKHVSKAKTKAKTKYLSGPHPKRLISRSNKLKDSISREVRILGNSVYGKLKSSQPYAPVHEFGGTIKPRGYKIKIKKRAFMYPALADGFKEFEKLVLDTISKDFNK